MILYSERASVAIQGESTISARWFVLHSINLNLPRLCLTAFPDSALPSPRLPLLPSIPFLFFGFASIAHPTRESRYHHPLSTSLPPSSLLVSYSSQPHPVPVLLQPFIVSPALDVRASCFWLADDFRPCPCYPSSLSPPSNQSIYNLLRFSPRPTLEIPSELTSLLFSFSQFGYSFPSLLPACAFHNHC